MGAKTYVELVLQGLSRTLDQRFTYELPLKWQKTVHVGDRVVVPFGGGNRYMDGVVYRMTDKAPDFATKPIVGVLDPAYRMSPSQMILMRSLRERYGATYSQCFSAALPAPYQLDVDTLYQTTEATAQWRSEGSGDPMMTLETLLTKTTQAKVSKAVKEGTLIKHPIFEIKVTERVDEIITYLGGSTKEDLEAQLEKVPKHHIKRRRLLEYLFGVGRAPLAQITSATGCVRKDVMALVDKGLASYEVMAQTADYLNHSLPHSLEPLPPLTPQQEQVVEGFWQTDQQVQVLLEGVTGSGKTRVYLELAATALKRGQQVLVLVPEISLTPQLVSRFSSHLTQKLAVLHNKVHPKDKVNFYKRIGSGDIEVIIGARSALFAPFKNLGLIVVDECHETSFKSDQVPRYDARDLVFDLSLKLGAPLVYGSASPSLELRQMANEGHLRPLYLTDRVGSAVLPSVNLIDLRHTPQVVPLITAPFLEALKGALGRGEQAIVLHNRKGFANYQQCTQCGHVEKCVNCDVSMTVHRGGQKLLCHYCGFTKAAAQCTACGGEVTFKGQGLEQVVEALARQLPQYAITAMDADTMKSQEHLIATLEDFRAGRSQVLMGTQILAKGLDFPRVTFVGVLLADQMLNMPDYGAAERTMQLLLQVAGRAGRSGRRGEVYIQTFQPEHTVMQRVATHNYEAFVKEELKMREALMYPPFGKLYGIRVVGEKLEQVVAQSNRIYEFYGAIFQRYGISAQIFPPNAAYYGKIKNRYVYHILFKGGADNHPQMIKMLYLGLVKNQYDIVEQKGNAGCHVDFSINPSMF